MTEKSKPVPFNTTFIKDEAIAPYFIETDPHQYILKKSTGKSDATIGYYKTFEGALNRAVELIIAETGGPTTIKGYIGSMTAKLNEAKAVIPKL